MVARGARAANSAPSTTRSRAPDPPSSTFGPGEVVHEFWPLASAAPLGSAASGQDVRFSPLADARLRGEHVEQQGTASTRRCGHRPPAHWSRRHAGPWKALVKSEATLSAVQRYNSGTNDRVRYSTVVDPQNIELNGAQIGYGHDVLAVTAGRQLIELADQCVVGSAPFGQNEQTFVAAEAAM